jgi:hypothetical protein
MEGADQSIQSRRILCNVHGVAVYAPSGVGLRLSGWAGGGCGGGKHGRGNIRISDRAISYSIIVYASEVNDKRRDEYRSEVAARLCLDLW